MKRDADSYKVILLTGAPGTGKSTLRRTLGQRISRLRHFDYGELLLRSKEREGTQLTYEKLREQSAAVITPSDVSNTDDRVIREVTHVRSEAHVIIDSHALTRETYGFRAIPFSLQQLGRLGLDAIIALRCEPGELLRRVESDRGGRRKLTPDLASEIQTLQESLCLVYAVTCGCPSYMIDTTGLSPEQVAETAGTILKQIGVSS